MTTPPLPKKKPKTHVAGSILDLVSFGVREVALPIPDTLVAYMKRKKKLKK
ncbi:MAG: hypothetical protein KBC47_05090 [Candidatus Peribacteraceae bacterium]|nr:hypothetical protein [Candidatus Peribacteraceae bacterium]